MKLIRGFKGRYFSLSAMTAINAFAKIQRENSVCFYRQLLFMNYQNSDIDVPPEDIFDIYTTSIEQRAKKACHCNCIFLRKFKRLSYLYKLFFTPPDRYIKTKSGTSPPISI